MNKRLYYRSQKKNKPNKPEEGIYEGQTKIDKLKKKSGGKLKTNKTLKKER